MTGRDRDPRARGRGIYAANTLASILGSVLAGFAILPWLGAGGSIRPGTFIGLLVAIVLLLSQPHPEQFTGPDSLFLLN